MRKHEFLRILEIYLKGLPSYEIKDIISDYEEHFEIGLSKGKTEEEISKELGNPKEIAESFNSTSGNTTKEQANVNQEDFIPPKNILTIILLIFLNAIIILGPYMAVLGILLGIFATGVGFIIGGLASLFGAPFAIFIPFLTPHFLTVLGFAMSLAILGVLIIILGVYLSKGLYRLTVKYINWNMKIVKNWEV